MATYNKTFFFSTIGDTLYYTDLGLVFHDLSYNNIINGTKTFARPMIAVGNAIITPQTPIIPSQTVTKQYVDSLNTSDSLQNIVYANLTKYTHPATNMNTSLFFNATTMNANANYPATGTAGALFSGSYPTTTTITQGNILAVIDNPPNNDLMYTFGASNPVGGMWIAGGAGTNTMAYSFDGIVWYPMPNSPFTNLCCAVAWNGSIWVAMGDGVNSLAYSYDGFNWVGLGSGLFKMNTPWGGQYPMGRFAWNGRIWVAVMLADGPNAAPTVPAGHGIIYSYDGINWVGNQFGGLPAAYSYAIYGSVTWNGSIFVATGGIPGYGLQVIIYSYNGIQWYVASGTSSQMYTPAVWNGSYWITHGRTSQNVYQSYNGINWITNPVGSNVVTLDYPSVMAYNGMIWLCFSNLWSSNVINFSYDGLYWFNNNNSIFANGGITDCVWNGYMWVLCNKYNASTYTMFYSYTGDAYRWFPVVNSNNIFSTKAQCVAWGGRRENILYFAQNRTLVLGSSNIIGNTIAYSYDGSGGWVPSLYNGSTPWNAYTNLKSPYLFSSANGATWNGAMWTVGGTANTLPLYTSGNTMPTSLNFTKISATKNVVSYFSAPTTNDVLFYNTAPSAYTIEAWIRIPTSGNQNTTGTMGIAGIYNSGISLCTAWSNNNYYLTVQNSVNSFTDTFPIGDNNWHHVAVTVASGVINGSFFYIDGLPRPIPFTVTTTARANPFCIGTLNTSGTYQNTFIGYVTEVRIWNIALSSSQIAVQWNTNVNPNTPGLVGYFSNFLNVGAGSDFSTGNQLANLSLNYSGNTMTASINNNVITNDSTNVPTSQGIAFYNAGSGFYYPQHTLGYSHVLYQGNTILGNAGNVFVGMGNYVFSVSVNNVQWNGNVWVAVGQGANTIGYSPDGFSWFGLGNTVFSYCGNSLTWNGIYWVAVGQGGNSIAYSPDGVQWTGVGSSVLYYSGNGVTWNGNYWVAVGSSAGVPSGHTMAVSHNGITWTGMYSTTFTLQGNDIAVNNTGTLWVATGSGGNSVAWSTDGLNWNSSPTGNRIFSTFCNSVTWNGRYWVACGGGGVGNILAYSADGNIFINQGNTIGSTNSINRVVWNGKQGLGYPIFYPNYTTTSGNGYSVWLAGGAIPGAAGSAGNTLAYSYNGSQWFPMGTFGGKNVFPTAVTSANYNGSYWVLTGVAPGGVGNTLAKVTAVPDNMTTSGLGNAVFSTTALDAAWNGVLWVAGGSSASLGVGNTLAYSFDGTNWVGLGAGVFNTACNYVVWQGSYWLAAGQGGNTLAYSYNGIVWTGLGAFTFYTAASFASWNGFMWVAAGNSGGNTVVPIGNTLAYSYNGINWIGLNSYTFTTYANSVAWNGRIWVASGQGGNSLAFSYTGNVWYPSANANQVFTFAGDECVWNGNTWIAVGSCNQAGVGNTLAISMNGNTWVGLGNNLFTQTGACVATSNLFGGKIQLNSLNQPQLPYRSLDFVGDNYYQSGYGGLTLTINAGSVTNFNLSNVSNATSVYSVPTSAASVPALSFTNVVNLSLSFSNPIGGNASPGNYIATNWDGSYITVVGNGKIYVSNNSGATFASVSISNNAYSVTMSNTGQYQMAISTGNPGSAIYNSIDYGKTWYNSGNYSSSNINWFQTAYMSPTGQYQFVGGGGGGGGLASYVNNNYGAGGFLSAGSISYNRLAASNLTTTTLVNNITNPTNTVCILYYPFDGDLLNYASGKGVANLTNYSSLIVLSSNVYKAGTGSLYCSSNVTGNNGCAINALPTNLNGYSFSFWVNLTSTPGVGGLFWSFQTAYGGSPNRLFAYYTPNSIGVGQSVGNNTIITSVALNTWYHIVWTLSIGSVSNVWVNGYQVVTNGTTQTYFNTAITAAVLLGDTNGATAANNNTITTGPNCYLDDFRYYDGILTSAQINNLYIDKLLFFPSITNLTCILYYPFDGDLLNYAATNPGTANLTNYSSLIALSTNSKIGTGSLYNSSNSQSGCAINALPANIYGYSFSCWINLASNTSGMFWSFSANFQSTTRIFLYYGAPNVQIGTAAGNTTIISNPTLGAWYHIVWTLTTGGASNVWVNGQIVITNTHTYYTAAINAAMLLSDPVIGATAQTASLGVIGYLDDFRYYDGILTNIQVAALYYYTGPNTNLRNVFISNTTSVSATNTTLTTTSTSSTLTLASVTSSTLNPTPTETALAFPAINSYRVASDGTNVFVVTVAKNIGYYSSYFGSTMNGPIVLPDYFEFVIYNNANQLWALSTLSQKLYYSTNNGFNWIPYVPNVTSITGMCLSLNATTLYLLTNTGGVYTTILNTYPIGSQFNPAPDAVYLVSIGLTTNGVYWINLPLVGSTQVYCLLDPNMAGGGWMMALKATRGTTFAYSSSYWTTNNVLNPSDTTRNDGDAKFHVYNFAPATDWLAIFPDAPVFGGDISGNSYGWTWLELNAVNRTSTLLNFYANNGSQINKLCNGVGYFTNAPSIPSVLNSTKYSSSIWGPQEGFQWYGINFGGIGYNGGRIDTNYGGYNRWGFAWNNESNQYTPDLTAGIGLSLNVNYSAGTVGGINRSMRTEWYVRLNNFAPGTQYNPAPDAVYLTSLGYTTNGVYWINLPVVGPKPIYCILDPAVNGGGWMMALKGTRGTTFQYTSNYWTTNNTLNPTDTTRNDGDAKFDSYNYAPATDWLAIFPDAPVYGGDVSGNSSYGWTWVEYNAVGQNTTLLNFYTNVKTQINKLNNGFGYTSTVPIPTASSKYSSSIFSTQTGFQWYGINYGGTGYSGTCNAGFNRWGFAWNNQTDQTSNDVTAGIGLSSTSTLLTNNVANYSAGDYIAGTSDIYNTYAVNIGINRPMRFEWYIRSSLSYTYATNLLIYQKLLIDKVPWGIYDANTWNSSTNILYEFRGNGRNVTSTGTITKLSVTGNGASGPITCIGGGTGATLTWPAGSIPANFTICSITRYSGANQGRILNSSTWNFLHGHHSGVRSRVYYNQWMTDTNYRGIATDWLVCCGKNGSTAPNNILIDGAPSGTTNNGNSQVGVLTVNTPYEASDFQLSYLIIWDQILTDLELQAVSSVFTNYLTTGVVPYTNPPLGSQFNPASSAVALVQAGFTTNGVYWINLPTVGPTQIYCILDPSVDGGGWMMAMKATRGNTFEYASTHWTTVTTLNPTDTTRNDGDAKFHTMNYYAATDLLALWPDISGNSGGSLTLSSNYTCWCWEQKNFTSAGTFYNGGNGSSGTPVTTTTVSGITTSMTMINWFNTLSTATVTGSNSNLGARCFIQDAKTWPGWNNGATNNPKVFTSQSDVRFYGFNYYNVQADSNGTRTRWGFGWNENTGGALWPYADMGSDDAWGGIGLNGCQQYPGSTYHYSAGDGIGCCQDNSGINRSARVEIYVR